MSKGVRVDLRELHHSFLSLRELLIPATWNDHPWELRDVQFWNALHDGRCTNGGCEEETIKGERRARCAYFFGVVRSLWSLGTASGSGVPLVAARPGPMGRATLGFAR